MTRGTGWLYPLSWRGDSFWYLWGCDTLGFRGSTSDLEGGTHERSGVARAPCREGKDGRLQEGREREGR